MDISMPISKVLLDAAMGDNNERQNVFNKAICFANKIIKDENLEQYQDKEKLIKCSILASNDLLEILKNQENLYSSHSSTIAHFPYLYHFIYREMISLIKLSTRKNLSLYEKMLSKLESIDLKDYL